MKMKKIIIILSIFAFIAINCFAQYNYDDEYINPEIVEFTLNEHYSIRIRQISEREFNVRKEESEHLRHQPYQIITDIDEAQKLLGDRFIVYGAGHYYVYSVIFNDGVKRNFDGDWYFWAYFPELEIIVFEVGHGGDFLIDLNDSNIPEWNRGNPQYRVLSPDKQFRINGFYNGHHFEYFLEKWNPQTKQFEFVGRFDHSNIAEFSYAFWVNNSTFLIFTDWRSWGRFQKIEIITNEKN